MRAMRLPSAFVRMATVCGRKFAVAQIRAPPMSSSAIAWSCGGLTWPSAVVSGTLHSLPTHGGLLCGWSMCSKGVADRNCWEHAGEVKGALIPHEFGRCSSRPSRGLLRPYLFEHVAASGHGIYSLERHPGHNLRETPAPWSATRLGLIVPPPLSETPVSAAQPVRWSAIAGMQVAPLKPMTCEIQRSGYRWISRRYLDMSANQIPPNLAGAAKLELVWGMLAEIGPECNQMWSSSGQTWHLLGASLPSLLVFGQPRATHGQHRELRGNFGQIGAKLRNQLRERVSFQSF